MQVNIEHSIVFEKIRDSKKRVIVNEGSSRSTKTYSIIQNLITWSLENKIKVTAAREKLTWAKASIIPDFLDILANQFHYFNPDLWNKTESIYYFPNGSEFSFIGLDEAQKLHSRKQNITWLAEAVEAKQKAYQQLAIRTTGKILLDYNPSYETHWIYDSVIPRDDCEFIKSTYKDNPFLEKAIIDEIERFEPTEYNIRMGTADAVSWQIYGLGNRASHKGLIYGDWETIKELPPESEWKRHWYSLDFGFTNDPSCLVLTVLAHGNLYHKQIFYERGLTNIINPRNPGQKSIQQRLEEYNVPKKTKIWCDSAEPKSIKDLVNCGYYAQAVEKGPDTIENGIATVKMYKNFITEDSIDGIKEKNNYKWKEDRHGRTLNEPIDMWNHFLDPVRYGAWMEVKRSDKKHGAFVPRADPKKNLSELERIAYYDKKRENESQFN